MPNGKPRVLRPRQSAVTHARLLRAVWPLGDLCLPSPAAACAMVRAVSAALGHPGPRAIAALTAIPAATVRAMLRPPGQRPPPHHPPPLSRPIRKLAWLAYAMLARPDQCRTLADMLTSGLLASLRYPARYPRPIAPSLPPPQPGQPPA